MEVVAQRLLPIKCRDRLSTPEAALASDAGRPRLAFIGYLPKPDQRRSEIVGLHQRTTVSFRTVSFGFSLAVTQLYKPAGRIHRVVEWVAADLQQIPWPFWNVHSARNGCD